MNGSETGPGAEESLFAQAVEIVRESQKASTSYLQRKLRIGYNSAARLVERMEREGLVSAPDQVGRRDVLALSPAAEVHPWERNAGKFDVPSSSAPTLPEPQRQPIDDDPRAYHGVERIRPIEAVAADLVGAVGIDAARAVVEAIREAGESPAVAGPPDVSADHLRQIVERVETLFSERDQLAETIRDTFTFAKGIGFDPKTIRAVVKARATDKSVRLEGEALLEVYRHALGIEGPDFVMALPPPSIPPPPKPRKLTAKEKQYRDALALTAATRSAEI
jgi:uncharacterized protein (UPF0335 family)